MNTKKQSGKRSAKSKQKTAAAGPSSSVTKYTGPIRSKGMLTQLDTHCFMMVYANAIASDGSGVLAPALDAYSQASSASNWSSATALFREYRILGMETHFLPINRYNTAVTQFPIISITDRGNSTALTSLADASQFGSSQEHCISDKIVRVIKMDGPDEGQFILTSTFPASSNRLFIKLYGSGLANSTNYFQYISYVLVQFRGIA